LVKLQKIKVKEIWDRTNNKSERVPTPINPGVLPVDERKEDQVLGILTDDPILHGVSIFRPQLIVREMTEAQVTGLLFLFKMMKKKE